MVSNGVSNRLGAEDKMRERLGNVLSGMGYSVVAYKLVFMLKIKCIKTVVVRDEIIRAILKFIDLRPLLLNVGPKTVVKGVDV